MKKYLITGLCAGCMALLAGQHLFAQDTMPYKTLPPVTITSTHTKVPDKVWNNFQKYFANAENPEWYEINKKFLVKYMTEDKKNQAVFTKKGSLVYNISYGYEKNLPEDIRKQVKSTYYDYNITRAIKVNTGTREIWVVNVEDAKNLILIRLENGELEEVERYNKS